jgi:hypothetical protein
MVLTLLLVLQLWSLQVTRHVEQQQPIHLASGHYVLNQHVLLLVLP